MDNNYVRIEFEALAENQSFARAITAAYCARKDPTIEELTEIKTAVSEAVSNAIIHGYENRGKGKILLELKCLEKDKIWIRVTDYGKGIANVEKAREPLFSTAHDQELSGMGFTVMESFADKVYVESEPGHGTAVTLIKNLDLYYGK